MMPPAKKLTSLAAVLRVGAGRDGGKRASAPRWLIAACLVAPLTFFAGISAGQAGAAAGGLAVPFAPDASALRLLLAGLCGAAGVAFLALAAFGARRRAVAGEVTYRQLETGIAGLLQAHYVRGEVSLAEYEAHVSRLLPTARRLDSLNRLDRLDGARVPLRLTLQPDTTLRAVAGAGGGLLLAAALALAWLGTLPAPAVASAAGSGPTAAVAPAPVAECAPWLPPGFRKKCHAHHQRQQAGPPSAPPVGAVAPAGATAPVQPRKPS